MEHSVDVAKNGKVGTRADILYPDPLLRCSRPDESVVEGCILLEARHIGGLMVFLAFRSCHLTALPTRYQNAPHSVRDSATVSSSLDF